MTCRLDVAGPWRTLPCGPRECNRSNADEHPNASTGTVKRYLIQIYRTLTGGITFEPYSAGARPNILNSYVRSAPSAQNALDIFKGEWASRLPSPCADLCAGPLPLFADTRISRFLDEIGGITGKTVLELGPLEGGHSYMLDRAGPSEIVSIEGNSRAYL